MSAVGRWITGKMENVLWLPDNSEEGGGQEYTWLEQKGDKRESHCSGKAAPHA